MFLEMLWAVMSSQNRNNLFYLLQCDHCFDTLNVDKYIACRLGVLIETYQMHHMAGFVLDGFSTSTLSLFLKL